QRRNPAAGADLLTLQRGGGMRKADGVGERPFAKDAIDEGAVKDVACSGGIDDRNLKSRRRQDLTVIAEHGSARTQRDPNNRTSTPRRDRFRGVLRLFFSRELDGKFFRDDDVVGSLEQFLGKRTVDFINV